MANCEWQKIVMAKCSVNSHSQITSINFKRSIDIPVCGSSVSCKGPYNCDGTISQGISRTGKPPIYAGAEMTINKVDQGENVSCKFSLIMNKYASFTITERHFSVLIAMHFSHH